MANIAPVLTNPAFYKGTDDGSIYLVTWSPVTEADACLPISLPLHTDRSIQAAGTFGGGSVALQGSNDGVNFAALRTPASAAIAITAAATGINAVLENALLQKPVVTGGTGQSLTISMLFRMTNPMRT